MDPVQEPEPEGPRDPEPLGGGARGCDDLDRWNQGEGCPDGPVEAQTAGEGPPQEAAKGGAAAGGERARPEEAPSSTVLTRRSRGWHVLRQRFDRGRARLASRGGGPAEADRGDLIFGDAPSSPARDGARADDAPAVTGETSADTWLVVDKGGVIVAEESGGAVVADPLARVTVEAKIEQTLLWLLTPAVHGIPKLGVPGAADRAGELLSAHARDVEAAVREVVAGSENRMSQVALNFCLERIPVFGCPTVLLRTTWGNLRSILIVAALYGHDLEAPRVQHEALLCLVPPGEDGEAALLRRKGGNQDQATTVLSETAQKVARMMIRGALKRATGLQAAVDCFELASLLYSSCGQTTDEDGFVHVLATPASAARDFFRKKSLAKVAMIWCSLPLLVLGMMAPGFCAVCRWVPVAVRVLQAVYLMLPASTLENAPAVLLASLGVFFALRTFVRLAFGGAGGRGRCSRCTRWYRRLSDRVLEVWPQVVTTLVFLLHAVLPAASTFSACTMIMNSVQPLPGLGYEGWDVLHRLSCLALGVYSLSSVVQLQLSGGPEADGGAESGLAQRPAAARALATTTAAARGLCVFAAWTYMSLALDLALSFLAECLGFPALAGGGLGGRTALGVVRQVAWLLGADRLDFSKLQNEQAMAFALNLVGVASQQRLVELLSRREVLFRLIGAERALASTLCLLLKGVAVACTGPSTSWNPIAEFLTSVAPPPICCVVIVTIRGRSLLLGAAAVVAPRVMLGGLLGSASSFAIGGLAGAYVAHALLFVWYDNRADLDSPGMRLALLVPGGVSGRAKGVLRGAIVGAQRRAVQLMAMGIIERAVRWWWRMSRIL